MRTDGTILFSSNHDEDNALSIGTIRTLYENQKHNWHDNRTFQDNLASFHRQAS